LKKPKNKKKGNTMTTGFILTILFGLGMYFFWKYRKNIHHYVTKGKGHINNEQNNHDENVDEEEDSY